MQKFGVVQAHCSRSREKGLSRVRLFQTSPNLSEPLHSLSKQQRAWSARGSTHSNLSEPLHSLSKQQFSVG